MEHEENIIEERKNKLKKLFVKNNLLVILGIIILLFVAWHIRTANVDKLKDVTTGDYTLGPDLDPFLFLRVATYIVENGSIPKMDMMRYVPLGFDNRVETQVLPYMMAYFHKAFIIFKPNATINYTAGVMFPVFMFLLTVWAFYFMTRVIFSEHKYKDVIAFISTAFLIVAPSLLSRTIAGIPEKESAGFFFLFLSFYLLVSSWKAEKIKNKIILAGLAGISTALMGLIWGGWIYVLTTVAIAFFLAFILGKIGKQQFLVYTAWFIPAIFIPAAVSGRYSVLALLNSTSSGLVFFVFFLLLIDLAIFKTKIKELAFIKNLKQRLPDRVISILFFVIFGIIASSIIFGVSFVPNFFSDTFSHLTQPYSDRLSFTVAENRQPYFDEWKGSFGPVVKGIPLTFWLFFIASIFLFYEMLCDLDKKKKFILWGAYVIFLFALIFSRLSAGSVMNGDNGISKLVYFGGFIIFFGAFAWTFYVYNKEKNLEELKKINFTYLFLVSYFIVCLIGARSAIRLLMALDPAASVLVGYLPVAIFMIAKDAKDEIYKLIVWVAVILVIISTLYAFYYTYQPTYNQAQVFAPSIYTQQWQKAMAWVRTDTPQTAVFAHWWDYGYWVQSIGNRATVLDGGNAIGYWNHLISRHVLTSNDEKDAMEFLYTHDATHLLIDSTDIGKYPAYSNIGSDENYDRYSWIPTFLLNEKYTQEMKNETVIFFQGGLSLDQDFIYRENQTQTIYPAGAAGIGAVTLKVDKDGVTKSADVIFVYNNQQKSIPLNCVYYQGKIYNFSETGYDGCLYIIPKIIQSSGGGLNINPLGAGLFFSERTKNTLFFKLYMIDKGDNFKLAHKQDDFLVESLKAQNALKDDQDFVFFNEVRGPIKIWSINYTSDIKIKPEYLVTDYPDAELSLAKK